VEIAAVAADEEIAAGFEDVGVKHHCVCCVQA
jgi:hypothetical protein